MADKKVSKSCFIVTPIGPDDSEIRRKADGVIDAVIIPVLEKHGYDGSKTIHVAHRIFEPGSINTQVINYIFDCDLVVANLTNFNPNVMYELGVRDAAMKPTILLCEKGVNLPFDIFEQRTIFFSDDIQGAKDLTDAFDMHVTKVEESSFKVDNPISRAGRRKSVIEHTETESRDGIQYLIDMVEGLQYDIKTIDTRKDVIESLKRIANSDNYKDEGRRNIGQVNIYSTPESKESVDKRIRSLIQILQSVEGIYLITEMNHQTEHKNELRLSVSIGYGKLEQPSCKLVRDYFDETMNMMEKDGIERVQVRFQCIHREYNYNREI